MTMHGKHQPPSTGSSIGARRSAAEAARNSAIARVELDADNAWLERAYAELVKFLTVNETMFVDDFWESTKLDRPADGRALGAVFVRGCRERIMEKTGGFRKSIASNMGPKPVWRSLIYDPEAAAAAPPSPHRRPDLRQGDFFD